VLQEQPPQVLAAHAEVAGERVHTAARLLRQAHDTLLSMPPEMIVQGLRSASQMVPPIGTR
jgi:hypothetical protein